MRILVLVLVASLALCAAPAQADPTADMLRVQQAFSALKSVHADMSTADGHTVSVDYVTPDKFHETLFNGMQIIAIGTNVWMYSGGRWMKLPGAMTPVKTMMQNVRTAGVTNAIRTDKITDLGPSLAQGVPARHYRIVGKDASQPVDIWVRADHLPVQVIVGSARGPMTIHYSRFNTVGDIPAPM